MTDNTELQGDELLARLLSKTNPDKVALLRGCDLPAGSIPKQGDWDLAVSNPTEFGKSLVGTFGEPDLLVSRRYVEQWFYRWNQVDLLPVFEWNGLPYLDSSRFWKGVSRGSDGIPRPRAAHDALIAWMTGVLGGASFKERYAPMIASAWLEDGTEFHHCLKDAFGKAWAQQLGDWIESGAPGEAAAHANALRRALFLKRFIQAPGECIARQVHHWWTEARHHLNPPYPWIAMLGPDGSGKSSVIQGLSDRLSKRRLGIKMIHWSPRLLRKGQEAPGGIVPDPHSSPPRGILMSTLKLGLIGAEWIWASVWNIRHPRAKSKLLISDRYYNDMLVDPRRYRFGAPLSWARAAFRFLPKPDHVIVLIGDADGILKRKQEVTPDELQRQLVAYRALANTLGSRATLVDCCNPLEQVVDDAYEIVLRTFRQRKPARCATSSHSDDEVFTADPEAFEVSLEEEKGQQSPKGIEKPAPVTRLRVLISAYGCSPDRGSEANVAWNLVRELSKRHELWVMTREINQPVIENCDEPWISSVRWVYFDPSPHLTFWRRGKRGISLFYAWWQILARKHARNLISERDFHLAHHITIGTYMFPSLISDLGVPLLFGPIGGGDQTPPGLARSFRRQGRWEEWQRKILRDSLQRFGFLHHFYLSNAWTLAATPATENALREMGVKRVSLMPQSASGGDTLERFISDAPPIKSDWKAPLRLVTACRLVHWKAVDLALEAVALAYQGGLDVRLTVLEEGPEFEHLQRTVKRLNIQNIVTFAGRLDTLEDVYKRIRSADALLHPALHEAFGQAVLESLALGIPVICLDWGGPGLIVDDSCGYKIRPGSRDGCVNDFADAIRSLASEKERGRDFAGDCIEKSNDYRWDSMADKIDALYQNIAQPMPSGGGEGTENPR